MSAKNEKKARKNRQLIANRLVIELFQAPFKYRFRFDMKLLRGKL